MWTPPMDAATWYELNNRWRDAAGDYNTFAVSERRPVARAGFMVLLVSADWPVGFVKVRQNDEGLKREFTALQRVSAFRPGSFRSPDPLVLGRVKDWSYMVLGPFEAGIHRVPRTPDLEVITSEISDSLAGLPRPEGTPDHWRPMHGDFTPWNLRQIGSGRLVLVDWEYASWAPPRADEVLYRATLSLIGQGYGPPLQAAEEVEFWKRMISNRARHYSQDFTDALLSIIDAQARENGDATADADPLDGMKGSVVAGSR